MEILKKALLGFVLVFLNVNVASGYEIVIDSTYYKDGRDDSKQVVYDSKTNLMWQDDESAKSVTKNWQGAIEYCQNLNFAGYSDWRLPRLEELRTIVDKNNSPTIKSEFKNTASDGYWSSTPNSRYSDYAWYIYFRGGSEYYDPKDTNYNVRCVRDSK
jgi:hypothetical protein